jgi:type II secretion system protein C
MGAVLGALFALATICAQTSQPDSDAAFVLDGVIVAENPANSIALVRRSGANRAQVLRVGQELQGHVLVEIAKGYVRFQGRGVETRLALRGGPTSSSVERVAEAEPSANEDSGWIRRAFPRDVARERLEKEIPVILTGTDLAPEVQDGEVRGLNLARVPDGTLLSESGLLPGDILVSINGEPLRGVDALWALIARLVDQEEIRLVIRRRGETLKLAYAFTR